MEEGSAFLPAPLPPLFAPATQAMTTLVNPTTVLSQSGNDTYFNWLINTADKFHIKELDWKAKTMYRLFQVASRLSLYITKNVLDSSHS